jgi:hypothetical protein
MPAAAMILAMFGLVGLLARQLERAGRPGAIGFACAFVGSALILTSTDVERSFFPSSPRMRRRSWTDRHPRDGMNRAPSPP